MATLLLLSTLILVGNVLVGSDPSADVWPGFLGSGATAIAAESVPLEWAPDQNMAWKTELAGEGQSSPIVWGGQVYVTAVEGPMKDTNHVFALDATSGRALASFASPIVYQGLAYWVNQVGVVFCFDAATGEKKYNARLAETCWATPVGIGDRIYFFGKDGATTVLATGPEHKQLAVNRTWLIEDLKDAGDDQGAKMFGGPIQYGVAVAQGSFFVRTGNTLYCIRQAN